MQRHLLKKTITVLLIILSLSMAVMIYFSNINAVAFDQELYESKYEEYNIHERFDKDTNLSKETAILLTYLESGEGTIQSDFFNQKEKIHLEEVRYLFKLTKIILNIAVIISLISLFTLLFAVKHYTVHIKENYHSEYFKKVVDQPAHLDWRNCRWNCNPIWSDDSVLLICFHQIPRDFLQNRHVDTQPSNR